MVDAISISDLFYEIIDKIEAGEPPPEIIIAGQTYLLKQPSRNTVQQAMDGVFAQLQEDKEAALSKLLAATIKGEKLILIHQQGYAEGTIKYQFRFEEGELPYQKPGMETGDNLAGLTFMGLFETLDEEVKKGYSGEDYKYTPRDCIAEIRDRLGIKRSE